MNREQITQIVLEVFSSILQKQVNLTDSFIQIGGESKEAKNIMSTINSKLHCNISVVDILSLEYIDSILDKIFMLLSI